MFESIAEELIPELSKFVERRLPHYPNKELLRDLIIVKVVEELNMETKKG